MLEEEKKSWRTLFAQAPQTLEKVKEVETAVTAFNANVDAVLKISGQNTHKIKSFPQTYPHDVENFFDFCVYPWKTTDFKSYLDFLCVFVIISIDVLPFCRINI
jgi:hypothetical protein